MSDLLNVRTGAPAVALVARHEVAYAQRLGVAPFLGLGAPVAAGTSEMVARVCRLLLVALVRHLPNSDLVRH